MYVVERTLEIPEYSIYICAPHELRKSVLAPGIGSSGLGLSPIEERELDGCCDRVIYHDVCVCGDTPCPCLGPLPL